MPFNTYPALRSSRPFLLALIVGFIAACLFSWMNAPLPWMIGPLLATAALRMAGANLRAAVQMREAGQWVIGTALGLYFTPGASKILLSYAGFIAAGIAFALALGAACGWLLHKLSGVDKTTAFFAMAVGGASEMATLGERHGAAIDRVAAAHSLRIMMVVTIIPFVFKLWDVHGMDLYVPGTRDVNYGGLVLLIALTSLCAIGLKRMAWPNAWVIGPLLMTIALTTFEVNLSALPEWLVRLGQMFIGISLGTRFSPEFLHTAPRYLASVAVCTLAAMLLAAGFGLGLASLSGMHEATAILATSPGGIAEMSLTAKTLQLGVPIVTAFHVMRLAAIVMTIGPLYRLALRARIGAQ
jgi:hypothetical protein